MIETFFQIYNPKEGSRKNLKTYNYSHQASELIKRNKIIEVWFLGVLGALVANSLCFGYRTVFFEAYPLILGSGRIFIPSKLS